MGSPAPANQPGFFFASMKKIDEPIKPRFKDENLAAFTWRNRRYTVTAILTSWQADSKWWLHSDRVGVKRIYFRVVAVSSAGHEVTVEIMRESRHKVVEWWLANLLD